MFTKLKCNITEWIEGFLYFSMTDEERHKYTAAYNREIRMQRNDGYSDRDSEDYNESIEGYCRLLEACDCEIAHDRMVRNCIFFEMVQRVVKEIKIRAAEKNKE